MKREIVQQVHERFISHKWTLALAESCTGGSLAASLTRLPNASQYFLGSLVVYSNLLKTKILNVPSEVLLKYGAVSSETVQAMLKGTLALTDCDYAIAVSGICWTVWWNHSQACRHNMGRYRK